MAKGRVSYRSEVDGSRCIDTSELIRVYGELIRDETSSRDTRRPESETGNEVIQELVSEIKMLRDEVAGLRVEMQEMRRLEHKPEPSLSTVSTKWWQRWRRISK
uniref:entry exclusion protein 1 n=1 Tax=Rahnella sp. WMR42 TaxID=657334 RepID=UPI001EEA83FA|nr:entry exclusion protein 1 [Rahnella sp. WMR42]